MDQLATDVSAPMARAVMRPLHDRTNEPKESNRSCQPSSQRSSSNCDFMSEPPGQHGEDRQSNGNKNDVDTKHFANKERRAIEIGFPFHDANQKQVQKRDGELREGGGERQD